MLKKFLVKVVKAALLILCWLNVFADFRKLFVCLELYNENVVIILGF